MNLYAIGLGTRSVLDMIESETDEDEKKALFKTLEITDENFNSRIDQIVGYVKNLKGDVKVIDEQISILNEEKTKLANSKDSISNHIDFVLKSLWNEIEQAGMKRYKSALHTVWQQDSPLRTEVTNLDAVPEGFYVLEKRPNRVAIKKHYKETGEVLPGVEMIQEKGVRIR